MERLKLHVDVSLSGMNGCMLDEGSNNLHADTSFSGPFGGFYGSAHVQAITLGYILKTN